MSNKVLTALQRPINAGMAVLLLVASVAPVLLPGHAAAAGQVSARSIVMSDSTNGATGVQYKLTFTPVTTAQELVIDFCSDTPFSGATCAFAAGTVPTVAAPVTSAGTAATVGSGSPVHTIKVTGLTMTGGVSYNITVTSGLTNPTTANQSFYARVYTYTTGGAANYVPANATGGATTVGAGNVDFGGIALSTTNPIVVTAKVMETLTFCVSGSSVANCTAPTSPSVSLGAGPNGTLDTNAATVNVYSVLSTNATSGASVTLNGDTLKSGSNSIPAQGGTNSGGAFATGANKFGFRVATPGTGMTAQAPYAAAGYALDTTQTMSTFGQQVMTASAPVSNAASTYTYSAAAGTTTPAGIYTATHSLVATGLF